MEDLTEKKASVSRSALTLDHWEKEKGPCSWARLNHIGTLKGIDLSQCGKDRGENKEEGGRKIPEGLEQKRQWRFALGKGKVKTFDLKKKKRKKPYKRSL